MVARNMETQPKLKQPKSSWWAKLFWLIIGSGVAIACVGAVMVAITYPKLPSMDELRNYQPKLPLQVYSADGVLLGQFGQEHRIYVDIPDTPKLLINAILSAEDERFYEHGGIDFLGIMRAVLGNIVTGHLQSGASTITMQVARNFFLTTQKTFTRKFNEILLSYKIEKSLTKDQILSLYINQIYLGQRAYGFAEAAETYFGKPLDKLTIAEYAVLAGLPKAPSAYNPVVNPKRSHEREVYVLGRMLKHGYISEEQYQKAINQKIVVVKGSIKDATDAGSYVAEMARQYLFPTYGEAVYTQGFKVYTTINSKMQQAAYAALRKGLLNFDLSRGYLGPEQHVDLTPSNGDTTLEQAALAQFDGIVDYGDLRGAIVLNVLPNSLEVILRNGNHLTFSDKQLDPVRKFLASGGNKQIQVGSVIRVYLNPTTNSWSIGQLPQVQGALVALNPTNGAIRALVGGFDFTSNSFNHVLQANRQPGSSFKPFIYAAALTKGLTTETVIDDSPACYPGGSNGSQWCPKNDDNKFLGPISLRQALTLSRNVVTVKVLNSISPQYAINYVSNFGFPESQFQPYLTMALGANEVTPLQMAQAYAVFANGGYLVQPYFIDKITDAKGTVLATTAAVDIKTQQPAIDPRVAFIMNSILQDVAHFGTGARAGRELKRSDLAGKTGTTNDSKDVWFDGYTPDLVAVTWVGYDQPRSLGRQFGATLALPIWIDFMKVALTNLPERQLPMPEGVVAVPEATWKGGTEYYLSNTPTGKHEASDTEAEDVANHAASEPVANRWANPASAPATDKSNKANDINDIINNIQD
jgi:penicillin-binding protein 1A